MCGIVGYFDKKHNIDNAEIIQSMIRVIRHRGPDDYGYEKLPVFQNHNMMIGFVRLSILDVSERGHQPMYNEEENICLSFNGEIYNAFEYKKTLMDRGYNFQTKTDTEILLYLYQEYGIDGMLQRINGMYAIAIADMRKHKLYLVRDRVGVKPLYFYENEDVFMYASEVKAFYAHPLFKNELNTKVVKEYCMFRYVAGDETLLKNVYHVLPAHYLEIGSDMVIHDHEYWQQPGWYGDSRLKLDDWQLLIDKAVKDRLLSDVPLGVQLSGGIDSSLVLECASRAYSSPLDSYSIIFENSMLSEKKWIDIAAQKCGVRAQHQLICNQDTFIELFEQATWHLDGPINHPNSVSIFQLCREARNEVKVLLTGEGADELFGGYTRYIRFFWSQEHPILRKREDQERGIHRFWNTREEEFIGASAFAKPDALLYMLEDKNIQGILESRLNLYDKCTGDNQSTNKFLNYEMKTYLADILNRQDKMSMAASIETRVPFLDYKLIETVRMQKPSYYMQGHKEGDDHYSKIPLKKLARRVFGDEFAYRPKCGFALPLNDYFQEPKLSEYTEFELLPQIDRLGFFDREHIKELWNRRTSMTYWEFESSIWIILALAQWANIFLSGKEKVLSEKYYYE